MSHEVRDRVLQGLDVQVGIDVENVADVAEAILLHGDRYLHKLFTETEIENCGGPGAEAVVLAPGLTARFAAKEAIFKLLRLTTSVPAWREVEILRAGAGWPEVRLTGLAEQLAQERGFTDLSVSMSHGSGIGVATVVGIRWCGTEPHRS